MDTKSLIKKIHLLESKLSNKYSHKTLEPFKFNSADPIEVQKAGKKLSEFIGITGLTFVIAYSTQKERVGGHIELNYSNDVFIEIAEIFQGNCEIVLAILAHEICHKYLHLNKIELHPESENEILTDIATVYSGLGKLSLNGCQTSREFTNTKGNKTTVYNKVGYLDRKQFSFVYKVICEMRKTSQNEMFNNLSDEATQMIKFIEGSEKEYFDKNFFSNKVALENIGNAFQDEIHNSQIKFARLRKNIRVIEESILKSANNLSSDFHSSTKLNIEKLTASANKSFKTDAHNYIKNLLIAQEIKLLTDKMSEQDIEIQQLNNSLSELIFSVGKNCPDKIDTKNINFLFLFECPICDNKLRIKEKRLAKVKCSNCNYHFVVDTGIEQTEVNKGRFNEIKQKSKALLSKIKSFFS